MLTKQQLTDALNNVFSLGQTYWQQGESEYVSQNKRAEDTLLRFKALLADTVESINDSQASQVCAEAYQVVGSLLSDLGQFETEQAKKVLDNLSNVSMVHKDVLPWPAFHWAEDRLEARLAEVMPLFEEARDALTAISTVAAKLHGVSLTLGYRMDKVGTEDWRTKTAQPNFMTCKKCNGPMKPGQAIAQTFTSGAPDFTGDKHGITMSAGGPGKLVDCLKCEVCGWSTT